MSLPVFGWFCGIFSSICFALMQFCVHKAGQTGSSNPSFLLFVRGVVGIIILLPLCLKDLKLLGQRKSFYLWTRVGFGALATWALYYNLSQGDLKTAILYSNLSVALIVGISFFSGEVVNLRQIGGILVLATGVFTLRIRGGIDTTLAQFIIGITGAVCGCLAMLSLKKATTLFGFWLITWASCLSLLVVSFLNLSSFNLAKETTALAILSGLIGVVGQVFLTQSYKHAPTHIAGILSLSTILWAYLLEMSLGTKIVEPTEIALYLAIFLGLALLK